MDLVKKQINQKFLNKFILNQDERHQSDVKLVKKKNILIFIHYNFLFCWCWFKNYIIKKT